MAKTNPGAEHFKRAIRKVGKDSDQFMLRLPDGMRDIIAEMAERNGRSMNAEIINALAHQIAQFSPSDAAPEGMRDIMNHAMAERIRQGGIQHSVREMGKQLESIAKELDRVVAESRTTVAGKGKRPPA